jgi:denticleless
VAWSEIRGNEMCIVTCSEDARHKIWRLGPAEITTDDIAHYRGEAKLCEGYRATHRVNPLKRKIEQTLDFTPKSIKRMMDRNEKTPNSMEKLPQTPSLVQLTNGTKRSFSDMCEDDEEGQSNSQSEAKRSNLESRGRRLFTGSGGKNLDLLATDELLLDSPEPQKRATPTSPSSPTANNRISYNYKTSPLCEKIDFNLKSPETPSTSISRTTNPATIGEGSASTSATASILFSPHHLTKEKTQFKRKCRLVDENAQTKNPRLSQFLV